LIQRLLFRSGREHCDLELAVEVRWEHFGPELAVEGQRGTHCDLELAVGVRRGS